MSRMRWTFRGEGLALIAVAIFAGTYTATRLAVAGGIPPLANGVVRTAVAGLLGAAVLALSGVRRPTIAERWSLVAVGLATLIFPLGVGWAVQILPSGQVAVAMTLLPLVTTIYAALRGQPWPQPGFWYAGVIAAALVALFAARHSTGPHAGITLAWNSPALWSAVGSIVLAMGSAAVTYVEGSRLTRERPAWQVISWSMVGCLPLTVPWSLGWLSLHASEVAPGAWAGLLYGGAFSAWIGFFAWFTALAHLGVARVSQLQYLQPFLALGYGVVLLHESCTPLDLLLAAGVVGVIAWGRRQSIASPVPTRACSPCPPSSLPAVPATSAPIPSSNC
jgi:drug/metabolite transporter (DMT)-like permease